MFVFNILTLFPEFFSSPLKVSLLKRAQEKGLIKFNFINPRDFSQTPHHNVDDRPFGGGPGMLMQLQPLLDALDFVSPNASILLMSPAGETLTSDLAKHLSHEKELTLICGRYEGIDARLESFYPIREVSLCPAVLNGGETAALAVIEAVCRFIPAFLGKDESSADESYSTGLLEYPQYTRPENYAGRKVPDILLGGNHARISSWRRQEALRKTLRKKPELLLDAPLDKNDADYLRELPRLRPGRNLSFCLCHYPVRLEDGRIGSSSLTNLDVHDIARISQSFGMGPFYILLALKEQRDILENILKHWQKAHIQEHGDRIRALAHVRPVRDFTELEEKARTHFGISPVYIASSALWPDKKNRNKLLLPGDIRSICRERPVVLLLGTGRGLDMKSLGLDYDLLRPLRFLDENHLSVRTAAAIMADRILGDFY